MGGEIAQEREWSHDRQLDWDLVKDPYHRGVQRLIAALNRAHRGEPALHALDADERGFHWIIGDDRDNSVFAFLRTGRDADPPVLVICNFTPVPRHGYRLGAPRQGPWREILNTDAPDYAGSGVANAAAIEASSPPSHGQPFSLELTLPPLATIVLRAG